MVSWRALFDSSNYRFNPHAVPLFLSAALIGYLAYKVLAYQRSRTTWHFAALCFSIMTWLICTAMGYLVYSSTTLAAYWFRLDWVGVSFIPVNYYAYTAALIGRDDKPRLRAGYAIGLFFAVTTLIWNPQMRGVHHYRWGFYPLHGFTWSPIFLLYFMGFMHLTFMAFWRTVREVADPARRDQIKCMFGAFLITYLGVIDFLPTYGLNVYPWGFLTIVCFVGISTYGIISYQLMDIRVVVQKTVYYAAVTGILTAAYLILTGQLTRLLEGWTGTANFWSSTLAAAGLALLVNPVQNRVREFLDERLFGNWLQDMSRGVAHEVKRPLNGITLPAALVHRLVDDVAAGIMTFDKAYPAIKKQLQSIIDQTLDAGRRIDALQRVADQLGLIDAVVVADVVQSCARRLAHFIGKAPGPVVLDVGNLPPVAGDAQQLEIAIGNFMKNGLEACISHASEQPFNGKDALRVTGWTEQNRVFISVKDNGPGMTADVKRRLFEPYQSTKGTGGMGIGLYLTHKIILSHGGSIQVVSAPGQGTEFRINLPKFLPPPPAAA